MFDVVGANCEEEEVNGISWGNPLFQHHLVVSNGEELREEVIAAGFEWLARAVEVAAATWESNPKTLHELLDIVGDGGGRDQQGIEEEDEEIYVLLCKYDPDLAEFNDDTIDMHEEMMAEIDELEHDFGGLDDTHRFDDDSGLGVGMNAVDAAAIKATEAADAADNDSKPTRRRKRGKLRKRGAL